MLPGSSGTASELLDWPQLPRSWNVRDLFHPKHTAGLWVDNAGIDESARPVAEAQEFVSLRKKSGWQGCSGPLSLDTNSVSLF